MHICSLANGEPFTCAGIQFKMLLPRDVTDSVEAVAEFIRPDQASPIDRHPNFDQLFFILKGEGEVTIGDESSVVGPQTIVFIPRNTDHTIRPLTPDGLEYIYFNVWGRGVPQRERGWKQAYSQIHNRRMGEAVAEL